MICLIPVGSPIVFINHIYPISSQIYFPSVFPGYEDDFMQRAGLVSEAPLRVTAQACSGSSSQATGSHSWPQERALPGSSAVQLSSSGYPKCRYPTVQHGPSLSSRICLLAGAMGRGSGCRTGNLLNTFNLAALPPRGQLVLGKQAQMPHCTPQSSQAMFFIALGARGGLRIKAVVPNSLLLF